MLLHNEDKWGEMEGGCFGGRRRRESTAYLIRLSPFSSWPFLNSHKPLDLRCLLFLICRMLALMSSVHHLWLGPLLAYCWHNGLDYPYSKLFIFLILAFCVRLIASLATSSFLSPVLTSTFASSNHISFLNFSPVMPFQSSPFPASLLIVPHITVWTPGRIDAAEL